MGRRKHKLIVGTASAGLAGEILFGLKEKLPELIAAEGLGALLGAPGAATLATVLGSTSARLIGSIGASMYAAELAESADSRLNYDLARASGAAIAGVIRDEAPKEKTLRRKSDQLEALAAQIEEVHSPEYLTAETESDLPVDPAKILEDPEGFLRAIALTRGEWAKYLRDLADKRGVELHLSHSNVRDVARVLETHYTEALYRELKASAARDGKAFAAAVLRLLDTVLKRLGALQGEMQSDLAATAASTEATWRAVKALRADLGAANAGSTTASIEALIEVSSDLEGPLVELRGTVIALPSRLDALEMALADRLDGLKVGQAEIKAEIKDVKVLLEKGAVSAAVPPGDRSNIGLPTRCGFKGRSGLLASIDGTLGPAGAMAIACMGGRGSARVNSDESTHAARPASTRADGSSSRWAMAARRSA